MRMLKPSPGECVDRQTILKLKMEAAETGQVSTKQDADKVVSDGETTWGVNRSVMTGASKIDISHFVWEHNALQDYLEKEWMTPEFDHVGDSYNALSDQLQEINAHLWKLEDEARVLRGATKGNATVYRAATVLFEITDANDQRAKLVQEINKLFNVEQKEKMYAGA